jgi:hypothetical protein
VHVVSRIDAQLTRPLTESATDVLQSLEKTRYPRRFHRREKTLKFDSIKTFVTLQVYGVQTSREEYVRERAALALAEGMSVSVQDLRAGFGLSREAATRVRTSLKI